MMGELLIRLNRLSGLGPGMIHRNQCQTTSDLIPIQTQHVLPPGSHRNLDRLRQLPKRPRILVQHRPRIDVLEKTTVDAECALQRLFAF